MDTTNVQLNPETVINLLREKLNAAAWQMTILEAHIVDLEARQAELLNEIQERANA